MTPPRTSGRPSASEAQGGNAAPADPGSPEVGSVDELERPGAERRTIGGRILRRDECDFVLGDALAQVKLEGDVEADVGDLVVVEVHRRGDRFALERVLSRSVAPTGHSAQGASESARFIGRGIGENLRLRAAAFEAVRGFFRERSFIEVDTPARVPSPGLDLHLDAEASGERFLMTSPEYQMKRLLAGGLPRIFQIARVFRRGEVGAQHNPEFVMVEWYRAFGGFEQTMTDTERLVRAVVRAVGGGDVLRAGARAIALDRPFERVAVVEAFERYAGLGREDTLHLADADEDAYFRLLVEKVEPALSALEVPVFLFDYPVAHASLARAKPSDPRLCERFELYAAGVELCNGFGELTDPVEQRARLLRDQRARAAAGKAVYPIDERFVRALEEGMPPCSGNALGLDRLLALAVGAARIEEVIAFPESWL